MTYTMSDRYLSDHARSLAREVVARHHAETMVMHEVVVLRACGMSWADLGKILGCSRQAASERYGWIQVSTYLTEYTLGACGGPCDCPGPLTA